MSSPSWQISGDYFETCSCDFLAFGLDWDDTSGKNNGHFAPFNWQVN